MRITKDNMKKLLRYLASALDSLPDNTYAHAVELDEDSVLTESQVRSLCKFMRGCSINEYDKFIKWYPISSKGGYALLKNVDDDEIAKFYQSMYSWAISVLKIITPVKKYLISKNIDVSKLLNSDTSKDIYNCESKDRGWGTEDKEHGELWEYDPDTKTIKRIFKEESEDKGE